MFTGIGGFELGIEQATKGQWECIGYSEINKYAIQCYKSHYPNTKNYGRAEDINTGQLPAFELLTAGFPCQAFSIAGKRLGFEDTRGTCFFEVARVIKAKQPQFVLLENVRGILSHDNGRTIAVILATLDELGYDAEWQVVNSKYWVPQNRERIFIIGHLRGRSTYQVFPIRNLSKEAIKLQRQQVNAIKARQTADAQGSYIVECKQLPQTKGLSDAQRVYDAGGIAKTLKGLGGGQGAKTGLYAVAQRSRNYRGQPTKLEVREDQIANQLTTVQKDSMLLEKKQIRRLTPTECERLQGFPDGWTNMLSDTQRYKCLGNAVTVNVIQAIIEKLIEVQNENTNSRTN